MDSARSLPQPVIQRLETMAQRRTDLERQLSEPEIMSDHLKTRDLAIRKAALDRAVRAYEQWKALLDDLTELEQAAAGTDPDLQQLAREEIPSVREALGLASASLLQGLVNSDDELIGSVILEVRAGTGGDEAGLWARDLLAMYERYAHSRSWNWEELSVNTDASVGGIRHAVVSIRGEGVWSALAFEGGVHSVKRVPATETQGRIHTSTATVAVLPEPENVEVTIDWSKDVVEHITTSQGPGGQNVNKVATAVHMIHTPSGVEVRMQESKSQAQNRDKARRLLSARVAEIERQRVDAQRSAERNAQIGSGGRSEKIRVYRFQDDITADQRLDQKFKTAHLLSGELEDLLAALRDQETKRRLESL